MLLMLVMLLLVVLNVALLNVVALLLLHLQTKADWSGCAGHAPLQHLQTLPLLRHVRLEGLQSTA
jgi:hypothetical protein